MLASASLGTQKNSSDLPSDCMNQLVELLPILQEKDLANPCAQVLSAALMLRYSFGLKKRTSIENAVKETIRSGLRTGDIAQGGESVGTEQMGKQSRPTTIIAIAFHESSRNPSILSRFFCIQRASVVTQLPAP